ncbi:hypothetical protein ES695_17670 [Candidatus Atribacteria bacterium 1244-E10-H5-B2]|nr:MAG: hypothetical protein ES695_17670 [Candidatus Atribacteria bacterium 1244-E10-H5-B2]
MVKESFEFSNLFSSDIDIGLEDRETKIERSIKMKFDEEFHTKGRAGWSVGLYMEIDKFIMGLRGQIRKEFLETYIKYSYNGLLFCYIMLRKKETVRLWAKVSYSKLDSVPLFVRDYEPVSRRVGVLISFDDQREFTENKPAMLEVTFKIIEKAFKGITNQKKRKETPLLKRIEEVEKIEKEIEIVEPFAINIIAGENGYLDIRLKLHKSRKSLLNKILEETILK